MLQHYLWERMMIVDIGRYKHYRKFRTSINSFMFHLKTFLIGGVA